MEKFYELSISGEESKLHKMIVPAMIISLFLAAGIFIFTGLIPALIFLILICLPLFIAKRLTMVEYDYEFTDGELEISAIYERVRRKVKGNINLRKIEIVAPLGNSELKRYSNVKVCDFTSGYSNEPVYGMIFSEEGIMKKVLFEPGEEMLAGIASQVPGKVVKQ